MSGSGRVLNQLTLILLGLTAFLALLYAVIFLFPQFPLNPFKPPTAAEVALAPIGTPTVTPTPPPTRPPTWTPTATPGPTHTPGPTPTPSDTPTPGPTRTPIATKTPTSTPTLPGPTFAPFKFTKTNDPITWRADPYSTKCGTWMGVAGQVLDRDGKPLPGISVVGWGGPVPAEAKNVFVSGSSPRLNTLYNSPAAYEIYIGAPGEFDFNVQIYENGQPVSAVISFRTNGDCRTNLAIVNIQRNH